MKKQAEFFKALGDENRLKILKMLAEKDMCVCEIIDELNVSQPAISHHLKTLKQAGVVEDRREGKWIFYSLNQKEIRGYLDFFAELVRLSSQPRKSVDCAYCEELRKKAGLIE